MRYIAICALAFLLQIQFTYAQDIKVDRLVRDLDLKDGLTRITDKDENKIIYVFKVGSQMEVVVTDKELPDNYLQNYQNIK